MAILYVTEFADVLRTDKTTTPAALWPAEAEQTVDFSGGEADSSAFASATRLVRLHTDADCHVTLAENPTATTSSMRMVAGQTEYVGVPRAAEGHTAFKVSVVSA